MLLRHLTKHRINNTLTLLFICQNDYFVKNEPEGSSPSIYFQFFDINMLIY